MNTTETSRKILQKMLGNINPEAVVSDLIKYNKNSHTLAIPTENLHYNLERLATYFIFLMKILNIIQEFLTYRNNFISGEFE